MFGAHALIPPGCFATRRAEGNADRGAPLGLLENVERALSSTNLIENLFGRVRKVGRRFKRWQRGPMVLRWTAAGAAARR